MLSVAGLLVNLRFNSLCFVSGMRARSMNMDQILRDSKPRVIPRRAKSTFVHGSIDKDQIEIDLQAVPEVISEQF